MKLAKLWMIIRRAQVRLLGILPEFRLLRQSHDRLSESNRQLMKEVAKLKLENSTLQSGIAELRKLCESQKSALDQSLQSRLAAERQSEELSGRFDQVLSSHADEILSYKQQIDWWALTLGKRPVYGVAPLIVEPPKPAPSPVEPPPLTGRGAVRAATEQFIREAEELMRKSQSGQASMPSGESWSSLDPNRLTMVKTSD